VVTDRAGKVKAVFGPDFVASLAHSLKGFRDQSGTMFSLPMTAYTYQGKDAKYYSLAVADNGQIVMSGVWSSGAERIAGNFTNPALFRVLSTDK
jgi:hypothetical protein